VLGNSDVGADDGSDARDKAVAHDFTFPLIKTLSHFIKHSDKQTDVLIVLPTALPPGLNGEGEQDERRLPGRARYH
jgi:hypothetical protein